MSSQTQNKYMTLTTFFIFMLTISEHESNIQIFNRLPFHLCNKNVSVPSDDPPNNKQWELHNHHYEFFPVPVPVLVPLPLTDHLISSTKSNKQKIINICQERDGSSASRRFDDLLFYADADKVIHP